jgi:hypothetical protein
MYSTTLAGHPALPLTTQPIAADPGQSPDAEVTLDTVTIPDAAIPDASEFPDSPDVSDVTGQDRLHDITDVIEFCKRHRFPADIVGRWVWIRFPEKPDRETRDMLKAAGFRWVNIRGQWAHNCGYRSRRGKGNPRWKYGSIPVSAITSDDLRVLKGVPA